MKRVETIVELRALLEAQRAGGRTVGFVPTMGSLHEGHAALMREARQENDVVVASIFVNPLQFAAGEDLEDYPRDLARDSALAEAAGVDLLFTPSVGEMYPEPVLTTVSVAGVSEDFEGASRPTHFAGVATVVAKLFSIVGGCRAYFGEKDFQQLVVVSRMAGDLSLPVVVIGCETVREPDGLAMSSRNAYLSPDERAAAPIVHRALRAGAAVVLAGERDPDAVRDAVAAVIATEAIAELDHVAVVHAQDLAVPAEIAPGDELRLLVAVRFPSARLIDNLGVTAPAAPTERS